MNAAMTKAERNARLVELMHARELAELDRLNPPEHPNPAVRVWMMLPNVNYGAVLKSAKSMKVLGYQVGIERRWMPVTVAKRLVKAGHCTWGLITGHPDYREPGFWICAAKDKK